MKNETLKKLLEMSKDEKSAAEVLEMIKNNESKYEDNSDGTTIKIKIYKSPEGKVVTEVCSLLEYRDISKMTLEELLEYSEELEDLHDEVANNEPDEDDPEYEDWEDRFSEIEEEMDDVYTRIEELQED